MLFQLEQPTEVAVENLITQKWKVAWNDNDECQSSDSSSSSVSSSSSANREARDVSSKPRRDRELGWKVEATFKTRSLATGKKSQSVPPPLSRPVDCMECPLMNPSDSPAPPNPCACPRKRKEPQDITQEHDRKFSRSSSLERSSACPLPVTTARQSRLNVVTEGLEIGTVSDNSSMMLKDKKETLDIPRIMKKSRSRGRLLRREEEGSSQEKENTPVVQEERRNSLSFMPAYRNITPSPTTMMDTSTTPSSPASPPSMDDSSSTAKVETSPCWVSQHLAHIMKVNLAKETMSLNSGEVESPRSMQLIQSDRYMDFNQHQAVSRRSSEGEKTKTTKSLSRQLSHVRKQIEQQEALFQQRAGYRPSQADRLNDPFLRNLIAEQNRLKHAVKEQEAEVGGVVGGGVGRRTKSAPSSRKNSEVVRSREAIEEKRGEILNRLEEARERNNRPFDYNAMTVEQVYEEKLDIQAMLIEYERAYGHPETKDEKEAMKEIYDRYRIIKRLARRSSSARSREAAAELVTIPEEEALSLTLASPSHRIQLELSSSYSANKNSTTSTASSLPSTPHNMDLPSFSCHTADSEGGNVNWHSLNIEELMVIQRRVRDEKKTARRAVKEFEEKFKSQTGKTVKKEDKEPLDRTYRLYKTSKSKLKLINALLSKTRGQTGSSAHMQSAHRHKS